MNKKDRKQNIQGEDIPIKKEKKIQKELFLNGESQTLNKIREEEK